VPTDPVAPIITRLNSERLRMVQLYKADGRDAAA
jgi:hypothetical protein